MKLIRLAAIALVVHAVSSCSAFEPPQDAASAIKKLCGGQWMIDEDRHHLVETHEAVDGSLHARSWVIDACFNRIIRNDTYRYNEETDELSATIAWSNGSNWECDGVWDSESKTLTWTAPTASGHRSFSLRLIKPNVIEYKILNIDAAGNSGWKYSEKRYLLIE